LIDWLVGHSPQQQSNQDTIYFRAWRDTAQHMVADISNGYWEEEGKVPDAMLRNTNKAKTGQLWHKGKAYLWKMPYMRGGLLTNFQTVINSVATMPW